MSLSWGILATRLHNLFDKASKRTKNASCRAGGVWHKLKPCRYFLYQIVMNLLPPNFCVADFCYTQAEVALHQMLAVFTVLFFIPILSDSAFGATIGGDRPHSGRSRPLPRFSAAENIISKKSLNQTTTPAEQALAPAPDVSDASSPVAEDKVDSEAELAEKTAYARQLELEISQIDAEMLRCRRSKSIWKTATVIGGVGTVGTAVGVIVQTAKIQKAKKAGKTEQKPENSTEETK
jgi:hypothetical protein